MQSSKQNGVSKICKKHFKLNFLFDSFLVVICTSPRKARRLDDQPLFGKGARVPPPKARSSSWGGTQTRNERAAEIERKSKVD